MLRTQARTRWSEPALAAEYGLLGLYGVDSVKRVGSSSSRSPYTSSVEMWCSRVPCRRHGLQDLEGADQVGLDERAGLGQRVVVVRLGREVHHRVVRRDQRVDHEAVGDVADDQAHPVGRERVDRLAGGGVRELVQHGHVRGGVVHDVVDEVGADEAGSTGDEQAVHAAEPR